MPHFSQLHFPLRIAAHQQQINFSLICKEAFISRAAFCSNGSSLCFSRTNTLYFCYNLSSLNTIWNLLTWTIGFVHQSVFISKSCLQVSAKNAELSQAWNLKLHSPWSTVTICAWINNKSPIRVDTWQARRIRGKCYVCYCSRANATIVRDLKLVYFGRASGKFIERENFILIIEIDSALWRRQDEIRHLERLRTDDIRDTFRCLSDFI